MKVYSGRRDVNRICHVLVIDDGGSRALDPRLDLDNHSPTGFEWGYGGSGPAQLALAILADALRDDITAVRLHQKFKWRVISKIARDKPWQITQAEVIDVATELLAGKNEHLWNAVVAFAVAATVLLTTAASAIECRSSPPKPAKEYWAWREIDGRQCWYAGKPGMDKAKLHWNSEATVRPRQAAPSDGVRARPIPADPVPAEPPPAEPILPAPEPPPPTKERIATIGKADRGPLALGFAVVEHAAADTIVIPPPMRPTPQPSSGAREAMIVMLLALAGAGCLYLAAILHRQTKWIG